MTESPPSAPEGLAANIPGQSAIIELLRLHEQSPERSRFGRIVGVSPLTDGSRQWYEAAVSEIEVGAALLALDDRWVVLHALPVGVEGSHIDHIAIGPGGVFIINTTNHSGQAVWTSQRAFLVSGIRHPYIRNMEYEMGRAERFLMSAAGISVEVSGILAVVAAKSITVRDKHRDVSVLSIAAIADWLGARPEVLSAGQVAVVARAAALESTWHRGDEPVGDRRKLLARFGAVRADVRRAWRLQVLWATATTVFGAGGFVLVTYSILVNALAALSAR